MRKFGEQRGPVPWALQARTASPLPGLVFRRPRWASASWRSQPGTPSKDGKLFPVLLLFLPNIQNSGEGKEAFERKKIQFSARESTELQGRLQTGISALVLLLWLVRVQSVVGKCRSLASGLEWKGGALPWAGLTSRCLWAMRPLGQVQASPGVPRGPSLQGPQRGRRCVPSSSRRECDRSAVCCVTLLGVSLRPGLDQLWEDE